MGTLIEAKILSPEEQLEDKIIHGFPQALNKSEGEYRQDFADALIKAKYLQETMKDRQSGSVSIIEPRISFEELVRLQDLDVDPAVFYNPRFYPKAKPYAVWMEAFPDRYSLPESFRQALPLEGMQMNKESIPNTIYTVALPGGVYEKRTYAPDKDRARILVMERYFDRYRLSQIYNHEFDGRVGIVGCLSSLVK